ncbi:nucleotidyltransferase family protein [Candidatus Absconditicoccus praedator]|uniref:nucleotidyltransferase family protein n=1 Tax=Candidatus Absconditicoccus praedator TaxID=2735562 RepID=UPI001E54EE61|nr:nucleotidyltransferase domain-containing protein [Candidatus Absconditicoccus praedator]UFX82685.1 nucleotidyltransferase domain-containing protein [Candidatus Absconditicoccus praedator]
MNDEDKINKVLEQNLDKDRYCWFLFGSRAEGTYNKRSDYDIGVIGDQPLEFRSYLKLRRELDESVGKKVDLVDFAKVDNQFKNLALKHIQIWNQPKNLIIKQNS